MLQLGYYCIWHFLEDCVQVVMPGTRDTETLQFITSMPQRDYEGVLD